MKNIVITGSTRGIGRGLAASFLDQGCRVLISGRTQEAVLGAIDDLRIHHPEGEISGIVCDVTDPENVQALWDRGVEAMGAVDIWINNAGVSGPQGSIWTLPFDAICTVVETNILGAILGSQVAVRGMLEQGQGALYNMLGMGSDGRTHAGLVPYGMSKAALAYFTRGLVQETKDTPLIIGSLQPGMVITDMIMDQYQDKPEEWERVKKIFSIIASRVEDVAPWLVDKVLSNNKSGAAFSYSSSLKLAWRFLSAPVIKRDPFGDGE